MRISDWSSDVCSSDLTAGRANVSRAVSDLVRAGMLHRHYQGYRVDHYNRGARRQAVYTLSRVARELLQTATVGRSTSGTPGEDKIGRATCRERVCQYVMISVVAVLLQKTQ